MLLWQSHVSREAQSYDHVGVTLCWWIMRWKGYFPPCFHHIIAAIIDRGEGRSVVYHDGNVCDPGSQFKFPYCPVYIPFFAHDKALRGVLWKGGETRYRDKKAVSRPPPPQALLTHVMRTVIGK